MSRSMLRVLLALVLVGGAAGPARLMAQAPPPRGGGAAGSTIAAREPAASAASAGDSAFLRGIARADSIVGDAVAREQVPGAVLVIARAGKVLLDRAYGWAELYDYHRQRLVNPRPMHPGTVFDLASVTKVMATTYAVMLLVDRGQVAVDSPVWRYLPEFRGARFDSITVRHLLTHTAGLAQWYPLYYHAHDRAATYRFIQRLPLKWGVGEGRHYSDLGFMLLGYMVERVGGKRLDAFLRDELYRPLGLDATGYLPKARGLKDFAATEHGNEYERHMVYGPNFGYGYDGDPKSWDGWRSYTLVGEVDDGNAWYANGGVAGHAGLFSSAAELQVLLQLLLDRGEYAGRRYLKAATIDTFMTRDRFGQHLGWMAPRAAPEGSFAHGGFTGTYVLGVPAYGLSVVLLTNRQNLGASAAGYFPNTGPLEQAVTRALLEGVAADQGRDAAAHTTP